MTQSISCVVCTLVRTVFLSKTSLLACLDPPACLHLCCTTILYFLSTANLSSTMATQSFRWRTVLEVAVISIVIYIFLGTPGFPKSSKGNSLGEADLPIARAKIESLVYPTKDLSCKNHEHDIHIFSTNPLVLYIDGFLSDREAQHLVNIR